MLEKAFGESAIKKKTSIYECKKKTAKTLKMTRVGQLGTLTINENVEQIKKIVVVNRQITIRGC